MPVPSTYATSRRSAAVISDDIDEAVVSMGESLEASILCTLYLRRLGVPVIRVKALSDDHAVVLQQVGANEVIFPERETARRVAVHINNPNLLDFVPLGRDYQVTETRLPAPFYGYSLAELGLRSRFNVFVIAVHRIDPEDMEFLPGPDFRLRAGDVLVLIGRESDLARLQEIREPGGQAETRKPARPRRLTGWVAHPSPRYGTGC